MKLFLFCIVLMAMAWLGSSSPAYHRQVYQHKLFRRSAPKGGVSYVKGQRPDVKEYNPPFLPPPQHPPLRKGQYMCGDKVCDLLPGEIPPGCNGMCQYRLP